MTTRFKAAVERLSPQQIANFRRDGFIALPRLIDRNAVDELRRHYDAFLRRDVVAAQDSRLGDAIRQFIFPSHSDPFFQDNPARRAARELAAQLLGEPEPPFVFDMLISKPPGNAAPTPWHQDFAYHHFPFVRAGTPVTNTSLQFWVALDDVDESNGCMHFIPGVQDGPLRPHYVARPGPREAPDRRLLATDAFDPALGVACPLPAGGCTIHMEGTPHFTTGNTTADRDRRAYIFNYGKHLIPPRQAT